jgi:hypothetical protein
MSTSAYLPTAGERPVRQWLGIYHGKVVNNLDPSKQGRVICQVPQQLGTAFTTWCQSVLPSIGGPAVGSQVLVMFVGGDPDYPVYFASTGTVLTNPRINGGLETDVTITDSEIDNSGINDCVIENSVVN